MRDDLCSSRDKYVAKRFRLLAAILILTDSWPNCHSMCIHIAHAHNVYRYTVLYVNRVLFSTFLVLFRRVFR